MHRELFCCLQKADRWKVTGGNSGPISSVLRKEDMGKDAAAGKKVV